MSSLPNGWVETTIGDILQPQSDGKLLHQGWSPRCHSEPAGINEWGVLKTTAIQDGHFLEIYNKKLPEDKEPKPRIEVQDGDLIMTNAGPRIRCGITTLVKGVRGKLMLSGKMYRMRFNESYIYPNYIEACFRSTVVRKEIDDRKTGMSESGLNLTQERFLTVPILLCPYQEQIRIANKLDSLLAKVDAAQTHLEKIPTLLKRFRQSVLAAATSGGLTREWREAFNIMANTEIKEKFRDLQKSIWEMQQLETFKLKGTYPKNDKWKSKYKAVEGIDDPLDESYPNGWVNISLEEIASVVADGDHNPPKKISEGIRHLTIKCINHGTIDFRHCAYVSKEGFKKTSERYSPQRNDVLITCIGTIGRVAIVGEDTFFSTDRNLAYVRLLEGVYPKFVHLSLESPLLQSQMRSKQAGNAQPALYLKSIRKLAIPFPSYSEQKEIVRRVESLFALADVAEKQYTEAKQRIDRLTQSLLAKAFRGELVPQNPNDEPAAELIKRIQVLREQEQQKLPKKNNAAKKEAKRQVKKMKLEEAPENYLAELLTQL